MSLIFVYGLLFPSRFAAFVNRPELYLHAKFVHILSVTLVFANAVLGSIWELRSLLTRRMEIIRFTFRSVSWMDAMLTAPLVLLAVCSGLLLGTIWGGVWSSGWLSMAFILFLISGLIWIAADIPTQYRINRICESTETDSLPPLPLIRLLKCRVGINIVSLIPLLLIFYLMIHKTEFRPLSAWFRTKGELVISSAAYRVVKSGGREDLPQDGLQIQSSFLSPE